MLKKITLFLLMTVSIGAQETDALKYLEGSWLSQSKYLIKVGEPGNPRIRSFTISSNLLGSFYFDKRVVLIKNLGLMTEGEKKIVTKSMNIWCKISPSEYVQFYFNEHGYFIDSRYFLKEGVLIYQGKLNGKRTM